MGRLYANAREQLREDGKVSVLDRTFRFALLGPNKRPDFDPDQTSMDEVFADENRNYREADVAGYLQVIGDPSQPFGVRTRIYQFFVEDGSKARARKNAGPAVLYEATEDGDKPLSLLNADDLNNAYSGVGYAISIPYDPEEPEAAPRQPKSAAFATGEADKDGNSVPDAKEYVDGDPDKGVRQDIDAQPVKIVEETNEPKHGTSAKKSSKKSSKK